MKTKILSKTLLSFGFVFVENPLNGGKKGSTMNPSIQQKAIVLFVVSLASLLQAGEPVDKPEKEKCDEPAPTWVLANESPVVADPLLLGRFVKLDFRHARLQLVENCKAQQRFQPVTSGSVRILTKPTGSKAVLRGQDTLTPDMWFDVSGTYVLRFTACPNGCTGLTDAGGSRDLAFQPYSNLTPTRLQFRLEGFEILNTMARHQDTLFVAMDAKVGGEVVSQRFDKVGDFNNGNYALGSWVLDPTTIDPAHFTIFSFAFVNAGNGSTDQNVANAKAVADYLQSLGAGIGADASGVLAAVGPTLALVLPNCDGVVLADNVIVYPVGYTGHQPPIGGVMVSPADLAGRALFEWTHSYKGPDTPAGCGSNASYRVTYSITPQWEPQRPPQQPTPQPPPKGAGGK
jgi:hypothetical protein